MTDFAAIPSPRLSDTLTRHDLPPQVQLVWHGLNDELNVQRFLASDITWGECDIHWDPHRDQLVLHHDAITGTETDALLTLDSLLARMREQGKAAKLDLKGGDELIERTLALVAHYSFGDDQLWFNAYLHRLSASGFRRLAEAHPGAILQAPVDFLGALAFNLPDHLKAILDTLRSWGMNRFSVNFLSEYRPAFYDLLQGWGFEVNLYGVIDLETFLQAVLLLPRSVTADFNFPQWGYYGRGSGEGGHYYTYDAQGDNVPPA